MRRRASLWGLAVLTAVSAGAAVAQAPAGAGIAITGQVQHSRTIDLAGLQAFPATTVEVAFATGHGEQKGSFTGALLWTLVDQAGLVDAPDGRDHLQHTVLARGQDGYAVALAIGEIDPRFEGKMVVVAYSKDGQPLPKLRLIVPGDARAGRSVRDLVALELR